MFLTVTVLFVATIPPARSNPKASPVKVIGAEELVTVAPFTESPGEVVNGAAAWGLPLPPRPVIEIGPSSDWTAAVEVSETPVLSFAVVLALPPPVPLSVIPPSFPAPVAVAEVTRPWRRIPLAPVLPPPPVPVRLTAPPDEPTLEPLSMMIPWFDGPVEAPPKPVIESVPCLVPSLPAMTVALLTRATPRWVPPAWSPPRPESRIEPPDVLIVAALTTSPVNCPGTWLPRSALSVMSPVSEESVAPLTSIFDDSALNVAAATKAVVPETLTSGTASPAGLVKRTSKSSTYVPVLAMKLTEVLLSELVIATRSMSRGVVTVRVPSPLPERPVMSVPLKVSAETSEKT